MKSHIWAGGQKKSYLAKLTANGKGKWGKSREAEGIGVETEEREAIEAEGKKKREMGGKMSLGNRKDVWRGKNKERQEAVRRGDRKDKKEGQGERRGKERIKKRRCESKRGERKGGEGNEKKGQEEWEGKEGYRGSITKWNLLLLFTPISPSHYFCLPF